MTLDSAVGGHERRQPRARQVDRSYLVVREAIADAVARGPAWRNEVAKLLVRAARSTTPAEHASIVSRCVEIESEVAGVRTDILARVVNAPAKITGHSRVVDVELALDNLLASVTEVRRILGQTGARAHP